LTSALSKEPREIDYRLRPGKAVERKMIVELCGRLAPLGVPLSQFRYAGMGSIYFVDFLLFHRAFGMENMISIEGRDALIDRCTANRPLDCIRVEHTDAASFVSSLSDGVPTVLWLDFDGVLDDDRLDETAQAVVALAVPSVVAVTVQVNAEPEGKRLDTYAARFARRSVPPVDKPEQLSRAKTPEVMYAILAAALVDAIETRATFEQVAYSQLGHFVYEDGARMLTVVGVLHRPDAAGTVTACAFDELSFYRPGAEPFVIDVPKLTHRERAAIDRLLPTGDTSGAPPEVAEQAVAAYAAVYRHLPFFVDAVL